jgi:hypothetical protein
MSRRSLTPVGLAVAAAACFQPALSGSFLNWDDNVNFMDNPAYRGLGPEQVRWAFTSVLFGHYIPLTRLSWSLNYQFGGMDAWGYHLANLLLHGINVALFYLVARRLLAAAGDAGAQAGRAEPTVSASAAIAALVFGVHPLRVEPVAWISGRPDLLSATFALLATWAYLRAVDGTGPARRGRVLGAAAALAAAVLSKGVALLLPAALLLLDVYPLRRLGRVGGWTLVKEKLPLLIVTLLALGVVGRALREGAVLTSGSDFGMLARLAVAAHSFVVSAIRFACPISLSPLYEMPARISVSEPRFALGLATAVVVTAGLLAARRRWPAGLAAWTFSIIMLSPTSAAVRQGADLAPDRYSYLAGLGFALLVGGGARAVLRMVQRGVVSLPMARAVAAAALVTIAGLGFASWTYAEVWRDSETLWRWAVEIDPACSVCHGKLGESVLGGPRGAERAAEAEDPLRRAITLRPDLPDAYFNLGTALVLQGRYAEAEVPLRAFMERAPHSASGPERLGLVYLLEGRHEAAIPPLRDALNRNPNAPGLRGYLEQALEGRARELAAQGRATEASALLAEARGLGSAPTSRPSLRP